MLGEVGMFSSEENRATVKLSCTCGDLLETDNIVPAKEKMSR